MKILFIIDSLSSGGKERQLVELLKGLKKHNKVIIKLVILSDKITYVDIDSLGIDTIVLKRRHNKDLGIFTKLYHIFHEFKPDIIHSWEFMCTFYSLPIAKILGIKFINGTIRNAPSKVDQFSWKSLARTISFKYSDIILSNSHTGLKSYNAPKNKSYCIYNGFDFSRKKNLKDNHHILKEFNISTEKVVGMIARFHKRKHFDSYINASIQLLQRRKDVTFITVGDGETFRHCKGLVPERYQEHIRFLGYQKDVESIVNILDIGVLVSYMEGISNTIMEYMAFEKPVIATRDGGNEELIEDQKTGFLVIPNDINDLVGKIDYLLNDKDTRIRMGKAGRERLENKFSLETMTDAHLKIYNFILTNDNRTEE